MPEKRPRTGVFLYPNGEVYVGQWSGLAGGGSAYTGLLEARAGFPPGMNCPDMMSDDKSNEFANGEWRDGEGATVFMGGPVPCREGWGVHLRGPEKYEGEWHVGEKHGLGFMAMRAGERFLGQFRGGVPSGTGIGLSQSGDLCAETWTAGHLVRQRPLFKGIGTSTCELSHSRCASQGSQFTPESRSVQPARFSSIGNPGDLVQVPHCRSNNSSDSAPSSPSNSRSSSKLSVDENRKEQGEDSLQPQTESQPSHLGCDTSGAKVTERQSSGTVPNCTNDYEPRVLAGPEAEPYGRSSLRSMASWSPREVARMAYLLGLGAPVAAKLRAHRVGGSSLGTLTSEAARPFLQMLFEDQDEDAAKEGCNGCTRPRPCAAWRLLVILVELFMKFQSRFATPRVSSQALRAQFGDLEIDDQSLPLKDSQLIGEGGYGNVYRTTWMHAEVAVKAFRAQSKGQLDKDRSSPVPRDFYKELSLLRMLRHPNITLLIGFCVRPQFILVTEFVPGGSLFDLLHGRRFGRLQDWNMSNVVGVARELCLGMVYLHAKGVVHCDLKSSNVLLNGPQEVKICDFGLARLLGDASSAQVGCVGTHHWMAPEVLRGEEYTKDSDVYSFGLILLEMISCKVPFRGYTSVQVVGLVGYGRRRPDEPPNTPEPLRVILKKTLQPKPADRRSFKELSGDFTRLHHSAVIDVEESLWTFLTG